MDNMGGGFALLNAFVAGVQGLARWGRPGQVRGSYRMSLTLSEGPLPSHKPFSTVLSVGDRLFDILILSLGRGLQEDGIL